MGVPEWSQTLCMIRVSRTFRSGSGHLLNRDRQKVRMSSKGVVARKRIPLFRSRSSKKVRCSTVDSMLTAEIVKTMRSRRTTTLIEIRTFSILRQIQWPRPKSINLSSQLLMVN